MWSVVSLAFPCFSFLSVEITGMHYYGSSFFCIPKCSNLQKDPKSKMLVIPGIFHGVLLTLEIQKPLFFECLLHSNPEAQI